MSDTRRVVAFALAAGVAATPTLRAQTVSELQERVRRLEQAYRAAEVVAVRADSAAREAGYVRGDSATVGGLHVFAPQDAAANARLGAERAWPMLKHTFGTEANVLASLAFAAQLERPSRIVAAPRGARRFIAENSADDIANRLVWEASQILSTRLDPRLHNWMGGAIVPDSSRARLLRGAYIDLLTAPSRATRSCFVGALDGCRDAFDLPPSAEPFRRWYGPAERRLIVQEVIAGEDLRLVPELYRDCVTRGDDTACVQLLQRTPESSLPAPLGHATRIGLVELGLELGGPGAFHRLTTAAGQPVDAQLAAAAGIPLDSLLAAWRGRVLAARPKPVTLDSRGAWVALTWGAIFGLLALRSTRWR
jgi:hypothetical protein